MVYSAEVVERMAQLANIAGANFRIFWDNAYAVHSLYDNAPELDNLMDVCKKAGTADSVYIFGSTSKVTFAGTGVAYMASSPANIATTKKLLGYGSIGPNKINQQRHVLLLKDIDGLHSHMQKHAAVMRPRFEAVLSRLRSELTDSGMGCWTEPEGGYFISFDTLPGLARQVVTMAAELGVKLTPAGATFPYGKDPQDSNIRLAPSYPTVEEVEKATDVFICCVKLASVRQELAAG